MRIYIRRATFEILFAKRDKNYRWLAERLGTDVSYVYRLVRKERSVSPEYRERLRATFPGKRWEDLFTFSKDESTTTAGYHR